MKLVDLYEFVDPEQIFAIYNTDDELLDYGVMNSLEITFLMSDIYSISALPDEYRGTALKIQLQL